MYYGNRSSFIDNSKDMDFHHFTVAKKAVSIIINGVLVYNIIMEAIEFSFSFSSIPKVMITKFIPAEDLRPSVVEATIAAHNMTEGAAVQPGQGM